MSKISRAYSLYKSKDLISKEKNQDLFQTTDEDKAFEDQIRHAFNEEQKRQSMNDLGYISD